MLDRPANRERVITLHLDGLSDADIAAALSSRAVTVTPQGITAFRRRHRAEIEARTAKVVEALQQCAIADKARRVEYLDLLANKMLAVIQARALDKRFDEPGYATGLMVRQVKLLGAGENAELVDEFKVDGGLIGELRATLHEAAAQLGQLPKASLEVNDNRTYVLNVVKQSGYRVPLG